MEKRNISCPNTSSRCRAHYPSQSCVLFHVFLVPPTTLPSCASLLRFQRVPHRYVQNLLYSRCLVPPIAMCYQWHEFPLFAATVLPLQLLCTQTWDTMHEYQQTYDVWTHCERHLCWSTSMWPCARVRFSPKKKVNRLVNTFAANSKQDSYHVVECHGSSFLHPYMVRVGKGECVGRWHQRWPVHGNIPLHTGYPKNRQNPTHRTILWAVTQVPVVRWLWTDIGRHVCATVKMAENALYGLVNRTTSFSNNYVPSAVWACPSGVIVMTFWYVLWNGLTFFWTF